MTLYLKNEVPCLKAYVSRRSTWFNVTNILESWDLRTGMELHRLRGYRQGKDVTLPHDLLGVT